MVEELVLLYKRHLKEACARVKRDGERERPALEQQTLYRVAMDALIAQTAAVEAAATPMPSPDTSGDENGEH